MVGETTNFLGYKLRRVSSHAMATLASDLRPTGLKSSEVTILLEIRANPKITSSEIGRKLGIKRANMTPVMAKLIKDGLVNSSALNGRSFGLVLSEEGQRVCKDSFDLISLHDDRYFSSLTEEERKQLFQILSKVLAAQGV